jgi:hypothetical protein
MPSTLRVNDPFTLAVQHDGLNTTAYELVRDGKLVETKPPQSVVIDNVTYAVAFQFPGGLSVGNYTFQLWAAGPGGRIASDVLSVTVVPAPQKPTMRILVNLNVNLANIVDFNIQKD